MTQLALAQLAVERRIAANDLLWCTGLPGWIPAADVPGLLTAQQAFRAGGSIDVPAAETRARVLSAVSSDEGRVRRTPLSAFAPQPRGMLLSEALDAARRPSDLVPRFTPDDLDVPQALEAQQDTLSAAITRAYSPAPSDLASTAAVGEIDDGGADLAAPVAPGSGGGLAAWTTGRVAGLTSGLDRVLAAAGGGVKRLGEQLPGFNLDAFWKALHAIDAADLAARFADALEQHDVRTPADLLNDDRMDVVAQFVLENLPFTVRWGILLACGEDGFRRIVVYRMRDQLRGWIGPQRQDADIRDLLSEALRRDASAGEINSGWTDVRAQVAAAVSSRFDDAAAGQVTFPRPDPDEAARLFGAP